MGTEGGGVSDLAPLFFLLMLGLAGLAVLVRLAVLLQFRALEKRLDELTPEDERWIWRLPPRAIPAALKWHDARKKQERKAGKSGAASGGD